MTCPNVRIFSMFYCLAILATSAIAAEPSGFHGRVFDRNEDHVVTGTVPNAMIQFKNLAGELAGEARSDERGRYQVRLKPGEYRFTIKAAGYKDEDEGRRAVLVRSDQPALLNFGLTKGRNNPNKTPPTVDDFKLGDLAGKVVERKADGTLAGVPNAMVTLVNTKTRKVTKVAATEADLDNQQQGEFYRLLEVGEWRASVSAPGFERLKVENEITIGHGEVSNERFVLERERERKAKQQDVKPSQGLTIAILRTGGDEKPRTELGAVIKLVSKQGNHDSFTTLVPNDLRRDLPVGEYWIEARMEGHYPATARRIVHVVPGKYTRVVLRLIPRPKTPPKGKLELLVIDAETEKPIQGAETALRSSSYQSQGSQRLVTDAMGRVEYTVDAGKYQAAARLDNRYSPSGAQPVDAFIKVEPDGRRQFTIRLNPVPIEKKSLLLTVVTGDGELPIPGATVRLRAANSAGQLREFVTNSNGQVDISLPADAETGQKYQVLASAEANEENPQARKGTAIVSLNGSRTSHVIELDAVRKPIKPPVIVDPVVGYVTYQGARPKEGVGDVKLTWNNGSEKFETQTTSDGQFRIQLPEGDYSLVARPPAHFKFDRLVLPRVRVRHTERQKVNGPDGIRYDRYSGDTIITLQVKRDLMIEQQPVTLAIEVTGQTKGPNTSSETQLAGATVEVSRSYTLAEAKEIERRRLGMPAGRAKGGRESTNGRGKAAFVALLPGRYLVRVSHPEYPPQTRTVDIRDRDQTVEITLVRQVLPPKRFTLHVDVVAQMPGSGFRPLAGANVAAFDDGWVRAVANQAGRASLPPLPNGTYRVRVEHPGFLGKTVTATLLGRDMGITVSLQPMVPQNRTLRVNVLGPNVAPLPGVNVDVALPNRFVRQVTDARGQASFVLPPGRYPISVSREGFRKANNVIIMGNRDVATTVQMGTVPPPAVANLKLRASIRVPNRPGQHRPARGTVVSIPGQRPQTVNVNGFVTFRVPVGQPQRVSFNYQGKQTNRIFTVNQDAFFDVPVAAAPPANQQVTIEVMYYNARKRRTMAAIGNGTGVEILQGGRVIRSMPVGPGAIARLQLPPGNYTVKASGFNYGEGVTNIRVSNRPVNATVILKGGSIHNIR